MLCPVCLENDCNIIPKCKHPLCNICMERISFQKGPAYASHGGNYEVVAESQERIEEKIVSNTPTFGRCPVCREVFNLFELRKYTNQSCEDEHDKDVSLAYEREFNIDALKGCTFVMQKKLGVGSIHFPAEQDESNGPYISFESNSRTESFSCLDDGSLPPSRLYFAPGYHFHKKTK